MAEIIERKGKGGKVRFYVRYTDENGRRRMKATKQKTRRDADKIAAEIESRKGRGLVAMVEVTDEQKARRTLTLAALATRFHAEYHPPRLKDADRYHGDARSVLGKRVLPFRHNGTGPTMGERTAASISSLDVEHLRDGLARDGYKPNTVRHTLRTLSRVMTWGRKVGAIEVLNPVSGVERPASEATVDYLDAGEVGRLLEAAELAERDAIGGARVVAAGLRATVAVALYCGLRKGELFGLRWSDAHLDSARLMVARSYKLTPKSGKPRPMPLNPELVPILRRWKDVCPATAENLVLPVQLPGGGWIMGRRDDDLGLSALLEVAKCHRPVDGRPWHFLRHTFASHFMMGDGKVGGNILALQKLLGHSTLTMTLIYSHLAPDYMQAEIGRMSFAPRTVAGVVSLDAHRGAGE